MDDKLAILRAKKVGMLIRLAREKAEKQVDECALWLDLDRNDYEKIEAGELAPSLPQLESLATYLETDLKLLLQGPAANTAAEPQISREMNLNLVHLRNHVIATLLKQHRLEKNLSEDQLAEQTGYSPENIVLYENGSEIIPFPALLHICETLGIPLADFFNQPPAEAPLSPATAPAAQLNDLPEELQNFIANPINRPYLDLAVHLSQMEADKLRSIAASLLEITY
ncbi:MAG: helix-turn-helix domain-containing protein [Anaerolineaceae bacterium]|nr:helix-turn-helix domain-containing protein [Anaerolineaceae bacterium]